MSDIKKRQHYVWRRYLRAWTDDETIWTYFKRLRKIDRPNLMNVAQERYFYKAAEFTEAEELFLKDFIQSLSPTEELKRFNLEFVSMFTITNKLKKLVSLNTNKLVDTDSITEEVRKLEINLIEDAHCKIEDLGSKLIKYRSLDDLKTINQNDYLFDAILFLCIQYFRTKNLKISALAKFKGTEHEEIMNKSWNIISYALATIFTKSISLNTDLRFVFLENNTSTTFITGDQPVFNLLNDKLNEKGEVAELELYYPITPHHALKLYFDSAQTEQFTSKEVDEELVSYLNKKVIQNSDFYVFANSKEQLEALN